MTTGFYRLPALGLSIMLMLILATLTLLLFGSQPIKRTLPDIVNENGLSSEHIKEINRPGVPADRYDELREEYQDDSYAQQMIDIFDPVKTEFHEKAEEYIAAKLLGDKKKLAELESWFEEFYPDFR